jgi:hypothetical protein
MLIWYVDEDSRGDCFVQKYKDGEFFSTNKGWGWKEKVPLNEVWEWGWDFVSLPSETLSPNTLLK